MDVTPGEMAMASAPVRARMSVELFRRFVEGRPDEEHWELINGAAMMMAPPTKAHQRIASNLERLSNDALEGHSPALVAYQRVGVNLGPNVQDHDPEPDVTVVDAEGEDERYSDRFYLAAEIVSSSDRSRVESKRDVYRLHDSCTCILTAGQDRFEVRVDLRTDSGWSEQILNKPEDILALPDFGLRCKLSDLYRGTPLVPRQSRQRSS
jgi:Uma2 family endonuclease